ncbi:MAG: stage V sporulation protein AC [Peptococcales bacterium]|jgi:stage V sporulation protein AC
MNLNIIYQRVSEREKRLTQIKNYSDSEINEINQELQEDYQNLVFLETQENHKTERQEIFSLREKVVEQQDLIKNYLQIRYGRLVYKSLPKTPVLKNVIAAFLVGGTICSIGQIVLNSFTLGGIPIKEATTFTSMVMIFLGALLTGLGIYDEIGRLGGAGSTVPVTGFANSIVSPAMEFKREGYIYGVGAKVFTIAGPVLLYGSLISVIIGLTYYLIK